jgi:formylglycine-generating enzyme required for sulfatase activity
MDKKWDNPVDTDTTIIPIMTLPSGEYNNPITVSFSNADPSLQIRYTTDGSQPTATSSLYTTGLAIPGPHATTLKAIAFADQNSSDTIQAIYSFRVASPILSVTEGMYYGPQTLNISCVTIGAEIRYTTNGIEPTASSALYSGSIPIIATTTLKAKAFKTGWTPSAVSTAFYSISPLPANFVLVAGGTFNNGTSNVTISSFYMDKYELTQSAYQAVMGVNPSHWQQTDRPVEQVSWFNAIEYCNRRSINEGLTPCYSLSNYGTNPATWPSGWNSNSSNHTNVSCSWTANGYRLPTEAEWEFAARGGNSTHNYTYSGSNDINAVAWYGGNSGNTTHTVGTKAVNELGLFDLSGNVWEWNWDIYSTYSPVAQTNPHGAISGSYRVVRGGCWNSYASYCTVSTRYRNNATYSYSNIGFRLCRISP